MPLPGVDDSYPPQKKSFLMFKFLHDHFGTRYKFFMRADDDVFVNVHRLRSFLAQLNSSRPLYLGQTGVGNDEEFGQLNLHLNENFCMGGPGAIISHRTLALMAPNIQQCLKNLRSTHEDVEIGRCIRRFAHISCTWSYDMQSIFYHNATLQEAIQRGVFPTTELYKSVTIHPIKDQRVMHQLYLYNQQMKHRQLRSQLVKMLRLLNANVDGASVLHQEVDQGLLLEALQLGFQPTFEQLNLLSAPNETWQMFTSALYSASTLNPRSFLSPHLLQAFGDNLLQLGETINKNSIRKGRLLTYNYLRYGYIKYEPAIGVRYILDLMMTYRKFSGKRVTFPVRRHAFAVQTFSRTQVRSIPLADSLEQVVHIVVPLFGRLKTFERFAENLLDVSRQDRRLTLLVVLFPQYDQLEAVEGIHSIVEQLSANSVEASIVELSGKFSRARALQASVDHYNTSSLLFFLDVDMFFTADVLRRVRANTQLGRQVYFPIVFSQYKNQANLSYATAHHRIAERNGYWRLFGFGIMSIFQADLVAVGGFNTSITGWGLEDVNLYERVLKSSSSGTQLEVVRVVEPELVHIYHLIRCDRQLSPMQLEMCLGTKLSSMESIETLVHILNSFKTSLK